MITASFKRNKDQKRSDIIFNRLKNFYPNVKTFLNHKNNFELLIAVILSAQCTDERINKVTPDLFSNYPDPESLMNADLEKIKHLIRSVNFFNNKAKNIKNTSKQLYEKFNNQVPNTLDKLISLNGVGRKTANVILSQGFNIPGIAVDTHVKRVSQRLGFTKNHDPKKIEHDLMKLWKKNQWINYSTWLIIHGRKQCTSKHPKCDNCILNDKCPLTI